MNRSLTGIGFDQNLPLLLLLCTIFECMCLTTFNDEYNALMDVVQIMVSEVLMFHENAELFPSGDSYDISLGNNETTERIMLVLVGIPIINQLGWVKVDKRE